MTAEEIIPPTSPEKEYFLTAKLDGGNQRIDLKHPKIFAATTPSLSTGMHSFNIEVFVQSKRSARAIEASIVKSQKEILRLEGELEKETNPQKRLELEMRKIALNQRISGLRQRLADGRKKLTSQALNLRVE